MHSLECLSITSTNRVNSIFTWKLTISWKKTHYVFLNKYMLKVNKPNTRKMCGICSKLTIKTLERRHWCGSGVFIAVFGSSHPEVFLRKVVLKICSNFTAENPCQSVISITLLSNFIEIALWQGSSLVNLLHIFRTPFPKDTSGWVLLDVYNFGQIYRLVVTA